jgi:predicted ATPase
VFSIGDPQDMSHPNLYVLTGGPGSGKTSILAELSRQGFACIPEAARQIIQEQVRMGGTALPWLDQKRYAEIMLERSIVAYLNSGSIPGTGFCDRGIPDTLCYVRLIGLTESDAAAATVSYRYALKVFLAPPWHAIYVTDNERKQTFAEAVRTYDVIARVYEEYGYELIELPLASPAERADFVLQYVSE